jgi:hypothetical protein
MQGNYERCKRRRGMRGRRRRKEERCGGRGSN